MTFLYVAVFLSWVVIIALCAVVYALTRQIGLLHDRIKPVGALSLGSAIQVGDIAPSFTLPSLNGGSSSIGGVAADRRSTLLFFLSTTCPVCKELLPILKRVAETDKDQLRIVFASDGDEDDHRAFITHHRLEAFDYILSVDAGMAYRVSKLPYGVVIDPNGGVRSHGLVNNREHIESLLEAFAIKEVAA